MFLMTLISTFYLLTNPLEIIHQHHLETSEGRIEFLETKLSPYTAAADALNREIQDLSNEIKTLSPQDDQTQIVALTEIMTEKMSQLLTMLPVLSAALSVDEDFQQIDEILLQSEPLSDEQQQVIDRIAFLNNSLSQK